MNSRNTVVRSLHDVGAAGWFGGSLMGAVALNGASRDISDPAERSQIAASRLGPLGPGLRRRDRRACSAAPGCCSPTASADSPRKRRRREHGGQGRAHPRRGGHHRLQRAARRPARPRPRRRDHSRHCRPRATPDDVARTQQQLPILQWITPVLTGTLVVLGAQQGEQQRPGQRITAS